MFHWLDFLCKKTLRWNWNSFDGLIPDPAPCYRLLRCCEWDVVPLVPRHWHSWPDSLWGQQTLHHQSLPRAQPPHNTCDRKRESVSPHIAGISLLSGLLTGVTTHTLAQGSLLPSPGVRCHQCSLLTTDQGWRQGPGGGHTSHNVTAAQSTSEWPGTTHMEHRQWHTSWTCYLRQSIYYILKSKNGTWTETR